MTENKSEMYPQLAKLMGWRAVTIVGCAVLIYSGPSVSIVAVFANAVYGAVILSFVGAVHWGLTMRG